MKTEEVNISDDGAKGVLLLSAALATILAYAAYTIIYNVYFHPLAKFPGPPIARITIYWKAYIECIAKRSMCHVIEELHAQYGKIELALRPFFLTNIAHVIKAMLCVSHPMRYVDSISVYLKPAEWLAIDFKG